MSQALNLINAGYDLTVWNRTAEKCSAAIAAGAQVGFSQIACFLNPVFHIIVAAKHVLLARSMLDTTLSGANSNQK